MPLHPALIAFLEQRGEVSSFMVMIRCTVPLG